MLDCMERRAFIGGIAINWLAAGPVCAVEPAGAVETSQGECYALSARARRNLASTEKVFIGDAVATGVQSSLGLRLGAATQVKLGSEARLRIDRFLVNAGGTLVLERGAMLYDHDETAGPNHVTVSSPFGLVAVRGTRFFAGPSKGVFGVFVQRGAVTVVGVNTAVLVASGFGTDIAIPGAEPTVPTPWGAARIASAMASVE
jgi:ferric-dicitrate binding protein FerR (iron transport regulator)